MTLQQLRYIVALDNYRHFATAAEKCYVAQPTLTLQVKKLEEELGTIIFDRKKHPLTPTDLGEKILLKARQILREAEGLESLVSSDKLQMEGHFNVGVIPTVAPYLMPYFLKEFSEKHPNTHLVIHEMQTKSIIDGLNRNTLDVGILATPLKEKNIREIPLYQEAFLVYSDTNDPLHRKKAIKYTDIQSNCLLVLTEGHCFRSQVLQICGEELGEHKGFTYQVGSIETLKRLVKAGLGFTLVPELSTLHIKEDQPYLIRFEEPQPTREVSLVVHHSFSKEALLDALRDCIQENLPNVVKKKKHFVRVKWR
ncbi:LysR family hydrogen peroxide-inducible transcriptional activator [Balneicella halophila]|uniref:LysR family hydrogen peroxide-inducible transcriptional activator n=1 Tax=Balneicella halophila TaxID=1537566 RepID=A0A7L4UR94_BALHA|nr:hydrogen peroxide-inducible genes activator [Balneicella halophila]PVX52032.1 LysR family hydrogen peroxide-inducible transcriptional activator [Balneicella halophila]